MVDPVIICVEREVLYLIINQICSYHSGIGSHWTIQDRIIDEVF